MKRIERRVERIEYRVKRIQSFRFYFPAAGSAMSSSAWGEALSEYKHLDVDAQTHIACEWNGLERSGKMASGARKNWKG